MSNLSKKLLILMCQRFVATSWLNQLEQTMTGVHSPDSGSWLRGWGGGGGSEEGFSELIPYPAETTEITGK